MYITYVDRSRQFWTRKSGGRGGSAFQNNPCSCASVEGLGGGGGSGIVTADYIADVTCWTALYIKV